MNYIKTNDWNFDKIIGDIEMTGATSVPLLSETTRLILSSEAKKYPYIPQIVQKSYVHQEISKYENVATSSKFVKLKNEFERLLNHSAGQAQTLPWSGRIEFDEYYLQKYENKSAGISPHRDYARYKNIIAIFNLEGTGRFCTCTDEYGSNPREVPIPPGSVTLMRTIGFKGLDFRPFHFIDQISEQRYVFILRQMQEK